MNLNQNSSGRYLGEAGKVYFRYQNQGDRQRGRINARKFQPYVRPSDRVLDFGCGSGSLLQSLKCRHRIGVEVNPSARNIAAAAGLEVHASLDQVLDATVDIAISNHTLEHVLAPIHELQALRSKLMPGGRLVICVPLDDWRTQNYFDIDDINHHLYTWTPLLMGNLLSEAGYTVEKVWVYTHAWPPVHWQLLDRLLPVPLFDAACTLTAWRYKRRQIIATAKA